MYSDYDERRMMNTGKNISSALMGFLIGGLVGAAAAMLMAPQSGQETRTLLRDKGMEIKDRASETIEGTRSKAEQVVTDTRSRASDAIRNVAGRTEEIARKASDSADKMADQADNIEHQGL